ncbi:MULTISPECIES: ATP-binding protein [unclassified Sulfitobacter]|nr:MULTISPECIES: ATP-binding protein [unclassified Sulfitobacter]
MVVGFAAPEVSLSQTTEVSSSAPAFSARPGLSRHRFYSLLVLCLMAGSASLFMPDRQLALALMAFSAALLVICLWARPGVASGSALSASREPEVARMIMHDPVPSFVAGSDGAVSYVNLAGQTAYKGRETRSIPAILKPQLANPSGILFRLLTRAEASGAAREDFVTAQGHLRISVHAIPAPKEEARFVWRIEPLAPRARAGAEREAQGLPMLMVGRSNAVLYMNDAARRLVGSRIKSLDRLFRDLPIENGERYELDTAEGPQPVRVAEMPAAASRRALYLLPAGEPSPEEADARMFQKLPVPLVKLARDGSVRSFNEMASRLLGPRLAVGVHLSAMMEGLGRSVSDWFDDTLSERLSRKAEFLRLTRDDAEIFVQVTLNRVAEPEGPCLIAVLQDATELKSLEAQFVQSQKMQAIGQLAGGVAHDFNNLLTAISGHCDLLLLRHDQGDKDYADLMQINQNANRAAALVGQLLAFSRKQTLRPETLDMRDTLADLTHLLNRLVGEKVSLSLSHDPVLHPIRADKRQLEQVLMNLVVNARDAMPAGGEITILTQNETLSEPLIRDRVTVPPGSYVTVSVSDNGTGIPGDRLQKVFEPFYTTKRTGEGTGLGLSTAYGIIKQTGGYIFVDSVPGQGTCFTLYFPAQQLPQPQVAPARVPAPQPNPRHGDGVILLVEDEAPVRAFASRALRLRGYTVLEAESAEAALRTLEDETLEIDIFVTDVVMPGMDGPSWVRLALKDRPDVRVVFVSGYAEDSFAEEQIKIPNSVFLPKPFSLTDLTETVHAQLH